MKQWKRLAALSSAIVMAAATLTYFPSDTLQNIRLEISASAEDASAVTWTKTESDGLTWTLYEDGTLNISGTGEMRGYNAYNINTTAKPNEEDVALEAILTENERIRRFGFTPSELERVKTNMLVGLESAYKEKDKTGNESYIEEMQANFLSEIHILYLLSVRLQ